MDGGELEWSETSLAFRGFFVVSCRQQRAVMWWGGSCAGERDWALLRSK